MPGRKSRTNRLLLFIAVVLCLTCGILFTGSAANPTRANESMPDMFVAEGVDDSALVSDGTVADYTENITDDSNGEPDVSDTPSAKQEPENATILETLIESGYEISPEASRGIWTPSGSNWYFFVDGTPYTGWLNDTDGHRYFFDKNGIMQTGWLDDRGGRYYLDLDGIMQIGDVTVNGDTYHLKEDGCLEGTAAVEEPKKAKKAKDAKKSTDAKTADKKSADKAKNDKSSKNSKTAKKAKKSIALTFDDGPSDFTDRLLDALEANNAKATFFLVGQEIEYFPEPVKRMEELGCEIGNHTYSHTDLTYLSAEEISGEIGQTDQLILNLVGHGATVLRPPYGSINDTVTSSVGTPMILWSIDTLDWESLDADQTVQTVLDNVQDGSIILMHDIYKATVDAAEILIPKLIEEGYELLTVHELAEKQGIELKTGIAYGEMTK